MHFLVQVELVVDDMRRSLARRAGVDRRLPTFVGMSGFQDYAINIVVLVGCLPVFQSGSVSVVCPDKLLIGMCVCRLIMLCMLSVVNPMVSVCWHVPLSACSICCSTL